MKRFTHITILFCLIAIFVYSNTAEAYWIWTPETKKFVNPKYAVKDSPKEQYDWAMSFYDTKDYQRAATEFEKLAKQYEFSEYASKSQYYVGLCYENMQKYYLAFQNYQKALDNFPHIANMDEIIAREFAIGNIYLTKSSPKVLGADIMAPLDRAVEIFKKVVDNAPYGKYSQEAQFNLGEALKKSERYEEAIQAYHKLVEDYPNSKLATKAMYEESYCAYRASLKPAYDVAATDNALKTFEKFATKNKDNELAKEADTTMKRLKDNVAEKSFKTAEFYESQGKKEAAIIYYQDVVDTYPDSSFVNKAKTKIEMLKKPVSKKLSASINFNKEKPEPAVHEAAKKKPWRPFSFTSKKQGGKEKADTAAQNIPKKKKWNPLGFFAKKEKAEITAQAVETPEAEPVAQPVMAPDTEPITQAVEEIKTEPAAIAVEAPKLEPAAEAIESPKPEADTQIVETQKAEEVPQVQEAPKEKKWKPLSFDTKKEPVVKEPAKKKPWKLWNFGTKKEEVTASSVEKKEKKEKKEWRPLNFKTKSKEPAEKKPWKPLSFETEKEPAKKKAWKPLSFETEEERAEGWKPWNLNIKKKKVTEAPKPEADVQTKEE